MAIINARTFTIRDLITEFQHAMDLEGRAFCPIVRKLEEMKDVWSVEDFEKWIFPHEEYAIPYILDVIKHAGTHHPPEMTAHVQEAYAWQLTQYPWEQVRAQLEMWLQGEIPQGIYDPAMHIIIGIIRNNHKNAKSFLAQTNVINKIPNHVDLTDFPCHDFHELKDTPLAGQKPVDSGVQKKWKQLT